jgi:hypothetical protein
VLFVGLVVARPDGSVVALGRLQTVLVGVALVAANSVALYSNLKRYLTGTDGRSPNLNANVEWWWVDAPAPMTVWFLGSLAFAGVVAILLVDYRKRTGTAGASASAAAELASPTSP